MPPPHATHAERPRPPERRLKNGVPERSGGGAGSATQAVAPLVLSFVMPAVCDICGKKPGFGNNISHSHRRTRRRWNPNIHKMRALINGSPKKVAVCSKCLKANKVVRAG
jgi:large subunit ribosomal protein L28